MEMVLIKTEWNIKDLDKEIHKGFNDGSISAAEGNIIYELMRLCELHREWVTDDMVYYRIDKNILGQDSGYRDTLGSYYLKFRNPFNGTYKLDVLVEHLKKTARDIIDFKERYGLK